jgi:hypothetical protein
MADAEVKKHYAEFRASADTLGHGTLEINGEDWSKTASSWTLRVKPGAPTELWVETVPGATVVEGDGVVKVFGSEQDFAQAVDAFLAQVPARALEAAALERDGLGSSIGESFIAVLREWVRAGAGGQ